MKILSSIPNGKDTASVLQYASASTEEYLNDFLDYWRDHESVRTLRSIERTRNGVLFHVTLKSNNGWVTKAVLDNNAFFSAAIPVFDGMELWKVVLKEENKASLLSQLERVGVVRINRTKMLEFGEEDGPLSSTIMSDLSPKQFQILKTAVESGYFDCPRRMDSRQLAKHMGIAQSTFLEHLRKSQLKILSQALGSNQRSV
jgi:predicted DNA binding protein